MRDSTPPEKLNKRMAVGLVTVFLPNWDDEDGVDLTTEEAETLLTELADVLGYQVTKA